MEPTTVRRVCFTWNNYPEWIVLHRALSEWTSVKYAVWQRELAPTTGTPHAQGYIEFKTPVRWTTVKNRCDGWWIQQAHGPRDAARAYCMDPTKLDTSETEVFRGPFEYGTWEATPTRGSSGSNLTMVTAAMAEGGLHSAAMAYPEVFVRHSRGLMDLQAQFLTAQQHTRTMESHQIKIHVLWGPTRVGKTHRANEWLHAQPLEDQYECPATNGNGTTYFYGYTGQKMLIWNEFSGQYPLQSMLRLLENGRSNVNTSGSYCPWLMESLVITTNVHPSQWYMGPHTRQVHRDALLARLPHITYVSSKEQTVILFGETDPPFVPSAMAAGYNPHSDETGVLDSSSIWS